MKNKYKGDGYWIWQGEDEIWYFEDDRCIVPLKHKIKNPEYIKYDENKGWRYKNGKELPWR